MGLRIIRYKTWALGLIIPIHLDAPYIYDNLPQATTLDQTRVVRSANAADYFQKRSTLLITRLIWEKYCGLSRKCRQAVVQSSQGTTAVRFIKSWSQGLERL